MSERLTEDSPEVELSIVEDATGGAPYMPDYLSRLREILARLRATNRSAIILVDGRRGTIQVWNAVPAGLLTMR